MSQQAISTKAEESIAVITIVPLLFNISVLPDMEYCHRAFIDVLLFSWGTGFRHTLGYQLITWGRGTAPSPSSLPSYAHDVSAFFVSPFWAYCHECHYGYLPSLSVTPVSSGQLFPD